MVSILVTVGLVLIVVVLGLLVWLISSTFAGRKEISGQAAPPSASPEIFIAGRSDNRFNFEGRIDEVAIYPRALGAEEIAKHYFFSRNPTTNQPLGSL